MRRLFDDLRARIEKKTVDASYLRRSDARSLAAALVDTIMWGNYERVMDTLQVGRHRPSRLRIRAEGSLGLHCGPAAHTAVVQAGMIRGADAAVRDRKQAPQCVTETRRFTPATDPVRTRTRACASGCCGYRANPSGRQDWEELLEANIKAGYSASNTAHLNAIKHTTDNLEDILQQQVRDLALLPIPAAAAAAACCWPCRQAESLAHWACCTSGEHGLAPPSHTQRSWECVRASERAVLSRDTTRARCIPHFGLSRRRIATMDICITII